MEQLEKDTRYVIGDFVILLQEDGTLQVIGLKSNESIAIFPSAGNSCTIKSLKK